MIRSIIIGLLMLASACCSVSTSEASPLYMKNDKRKLIASECMQSPERFGFPYTREELADLSLHLGMKPDQHQFCWRVARSLLP